MPMKNTVLIILVFIFSFNCFAQGNSRINESWKEVRQNLLFKSEIVLKLTARFQKSKKMNKSELAKTTANAKNLKTECEKAAFNAAAVRNLKLKNDNLTTYLTRTLVNLQHDPELISNEEVLFMLDELYVAENNIFSRIKKYNEICKSLNKKELIYEISSDSKPPNVEF